MAWVFKAPLDVVLGERPGKEWTAPPRDSPVEPRLKRRPVYELRTYIAARDRFEHLVTRFREHTDRLFRKHNMQPVGYWVPAEGPPISKRTFVYILKHPSRYDAWKNWVAFTNDREWQRVLDQPVFQGLHIGKPESTFMTVIDDSIVKLNDGDGRAGVYELATYTASPGKLPMLTGHFREHATGLFNANAMQHIASWTPFDRPESESRLISLICHSNREQVDVNWKAAKRDARWRQATSDSETGDSLLAKPPEQSYLIPLDFSPSK
jgi:hypothetical protein